MKSQEPKDARVFDLDVEEEKTSREIFDKLLRWLEWKRIPEPEDMAQEALRRGFKRLREGEEITCQDPASYFFGIARNLIRESWKAHRQEQLEEQQLPEQQSSFRTLNRMEQRVFLRECFHKLSPEERELMIAYTNDEVQKWGEKMGLQPGAVRLRVHRARKRLEEFASAASKAQKNSRNKLPTSSII